LIAVLPENWFISINSINNTKTKIPHLSDPVKPNLNTYY